MRRPLPDSTGVRHGRKYSASSSNTPISLTNFPDFGPGVVQLAGAVGGGDGATTNPAGLIGQGITFGVGRLSDTGVSFAAILRALEGDADTNIISTPSIVTTDNEEVAWRCRSFRDHGYNVQERLRLLEMEQKLPYIHTRLGWNYRMTEMQSVIGLCNAWGELIVRDPSLDVFDTIRKVTDPLLNGLVSPRPTD